MKDGRFNGTRTFILANWPRFVLLYLGMVAALVIIGVSAMQGWLSFVPLTMAALLILIYFFGAGIWEARQRYDFDGITPHHVLFDMGQVPATERFAYIDLGLQRQAIGLSRRLTTGQVIVIDIYNPQSFQSGDFTWTILASQYRAGYLELNSNKNEPLPDGNIFVAYRFQFTEPNDVVTADYDSSEVMEIVLTIRNFPQTANPEPQAITVKGTADVRNFIR